MRSEKAFAVTNTGDIKMSGKFLARASALSLAVFLVACGGDDASTPIVNVNTGQGDSTNDSGVTTPEDTDTGDTTTPGDGTTSPDNDTPETQALLGTGKGASFVEGQLFAAAPVLQIEEAHQFDITLADPETKEPWLRSGQSVSYTSPCIDAGIASIDGPTSADSGIIKANYTSTGCYGEDLIHAFIGSSATPAASGTVTIEQPEFLELALADYDPATGTITATGSIHSSSTSVSRYGQARLTVAIVDVNDSNKLQAGMPFTVNFASSCAEGLNSSELGSTSVNTTTGIAETIFTAGNCPQNPQRITATLEDDAGNVSPAFVDINVDATQAFQLVAALPEPMSIAPSFLSGEDRETVSTIRFTLKDQAGETGDGIPFEDVTFTIDTPNTAEFVEQGTGSILNSITVTTDSNGVATAQVRAKEGVDHEEFRIVATYGDLTTYSMPIVVNSMLPYEPRFSLSTDNFAPNAWLKNGVPSGLTLYVADQNGNRVRGNTYANFQIDPSQEHGSVDPDCVVEEGRCSVEWLSLNTDSPYSTIIASTHGRISDTEIGTITTSITLLMSTNQNVFLELIRSGDVDPAGTEYCATAWVELPDQGTTKYSPPVGTEISFEVDTGEFLSGATESKTIPSVGSLVFDNDGYEVCTKIKPEIDDTVVPNVYNIELTATVQTPDDGDSESQITSDTWTD